MEIFLIKNELVAVKDGVTFRSHHRRSFIRRATHVFDVSDRRVLAIELTKNRHDGAKLGFFEFEAALKYIEDECPEFSPKVKGIHLLDSHYETVQYLISIGEEAEVAWED